MSVFAYRDAIELHGWDARARAWHGPTPLQFSTRDCAKLIDKLRGSTGCWYGRLYADLPGEPRLSFCACIHDLGDAGLGTLDLEGTEGGPLQFLLVAPARRRHKLRADMAFEFVAFVRFLAGPESVGDELALHDYIERALEGSPDTTLVFSVETQVLLPEVQILLAQQAERLTFGILAALAKEESIPAAASSRRLGTRGGTGIDGPRFNMDQNRL